MDQIELKQEFYVCIYIAEFPAQALLRLRPHLSRHAVAVMQGEAPLETVCSSNKSASELGVRVGMTLAEMELFPKLTILKRSHAEESGATKAIIGAAQAFTPRLELLKERSGAFVMVLDMTGSMTLFGSQSSTIAKLQNAFTQLSFITRIAASGNFYTAVCLAHFASLKPILVLPGEEAKVLATLPVSALLLTPDQAQTFSLWGLQTVGDFAALPEIEVIVRLGQPGKRLLLLAHGKHPHLMIPIEDAFCLEEQIQMDEPLDLMESLLFVIGPMLDQLLVRAQTRVLALASVTTTYFLDDDTQHIRTIKPALAIADRKVLLKLMHLDLQAYPPAVGVVKILLQATEGPRSKVQVGLFSPQRPETMALNVTLARIQALVGQGRVGRASLDDGHGQECFTVEQFIVHDDRSSSPTHGDGVTALRCLRPPLTIRVTNSSSVPSCFYINGNFYTVCRAYGPWRKSGEWWSQRVWSFEEWDVHATSDNKDVWLGLLTHDLLRKEWSVTALYD